MSPARRALVAIVVFSVAGPLFAADAVRGSGNGIVQQRELGAFSGVALGGPFQLVLRQGVQEAVEVRGDDNVVPLVETRIETSVGGRRSLQVDLRRGARLAPSTRVVITVDFVRLDDLALGGSGEITGSGLRSQALAVSIGGTGSVRLAALEAERLDVSIGGSGTLDVQGRAGRLELNIGGSGRAAAGKLVAKDVRISVAGSGHAEVNAATTLEVAIAGGGEVLHVGSAQPRTTIVGSGKVRRGA